MAAREKMATKKKKNEGQADVETDPNGGKKR